MIDVDTSLIDQLLINLLVNAIDAVKEVSHPSIILSGYIQPNNRPILKIADNGAGMSPEVADKIFIPFFSTKKTGSGIGLSLCKQIMLLHKGNIQVQSREGEGTVFTLYF
jgi:signal transduction histidine kinase